MALHFVTKTFAGLGAGLTLLAAATPALADTPPGHTAAAQPPVQEQRRSVLPPIPAFARGTGAALLQIPARTQRDGSLYQGGNCGAAVLSMVLLGHGIDVPVVSLRAQANVIQPPVTLDDGLHWDTLTEVAKGYGVSTRGVYAEGTYRTWTPAELRQELLGGNPIMTLVRYRRLPTNLASQSSADHYILLTGFDGEDFIYNDSLPYTGTGQSSRISEAQLVEAWDATWPRRAAMVFDRLDAGPAPRLAPDQVGRDPGRVVAQPVQLAPAIAAPQQQPPTAPAPSSRPAEAMVPPIAALDQAGQLVGAADRPPAPAGAAPAGGWALAAVAVAGLIGLGAFVRSGLFRYTFSLQRVRQPRP